MNVVGAPGGELPEAVRQRAAHLGELGARWVSELPGLVAELQQRWSITVAGPPLSGGSAAYVAPAHTDDGGDAILKIAMPLTDAGDPIRTILNARGQGYVRLLAHDLDRRAMLQEVLGSSMDQLGLAPERAIEALSATLRQAWRAPLEAAAESAPRKAEQLGHLVHRLWHKLGQPCSERVVARALRYAERRAADVDPDRCVVVHGDPHPANALRVLSPRAGAESGFVFIDPEGFVADPTYDLGVVLRDWCPQLLASDEPAALARRHCSLVAATSGLDEEAIWEWGYLERVSSGLYCLDLGLNDLAGPFLTTADALATT